MRPFVTEAMELATNGLTWQHPETGRTIVSYITAPFHMSTACMTNAVNHSADLMACTGALFVNIQENHINCRAKGMCMSNLLGKRTTPGIVIGSGCKLLWPWIGGFQ